MAKMTCLSVGNGCRRQHQRHEVVKRDPSRGTVEFSRKAMVQKGARELLRARVSRRKNGVAGMGPASEVQEVHARSRGCGGRWTRR